MESSEDKDHLNFRNEKHLKSIIGEEELLLSDKIIKINRYGLSQERNILITSNAIYNLKKKSNYILFIINIFNYLKI
jgi:uncharacterized protein (UPF0216 family)